MLRIYITNIHRISILIIIIIKYNYYILNIIIIIIYELHRKIIQYPCNDQNISYYFIREHTCQNSKSFK